MILPCIGVLTQKGCLSGPKSLHYSFCLGIKHLPVFSMETVYCRSAASQYTDKRANFSTTWPLTNGPASSLQWAVVSGPIIYHAPHVLIVCLKDRNSQTLRDDDTEIIF